MFFVAICMRQKFGLLQLGPHPASAKAQEHVAAEHRAQDASYLTAAVELGPECCPVPLDLTCVASQHVLGWTWADLYCYAAAALLHFGCCTSPSQTVHHGRISRCVPQSC